MTRNEPFWRTNSSFSPPLSRSWEHRLHSDGLSYGSQDAGGITLSSSSLSSNSRESRSWLRGENVSDGHVSYYSSPSGDYQAQQLISAPVQGISIDDYVCITMREPASGALAYSQGREGTSGVPNAVGSTSSRSDGSDSEFISIMHGHSHRNFPSCYSFISKPVHPLSLPNQTLEDEEVSGTATTIDSNIAFSSNTKSIGALNELQSPPGFVDGGTPQREAFRWSSSSSIDYSDASERQEPECSGFQLNNTTSDGMKKCGLCGKCLSQRSPWSSRWIVQSGDMPVTGVLSCQHVYHAECLERTTPKTQKHDPPCPLCERSEEKFTEQWAVSRLKNGLPRLRSLGEEGPSRSWSCGQVGDCVAGALNVQPWNSMLLLNRGRLKRHFSLKAGNSSKERAEKLKKGGPCISHSPTETKTADQGKVGCSKTENVPVLKRL